MSGLGSVRVRIVALAGVIVVLLAAGLWIAMSHAKAQSTAGGTGRQGERGGGAANDASKAKTPLRVVSVTPATGTRGVSGAAPIKVTFSAPLATDSAMPTVRPKVAGSWQGAGKDAIEFVPSHGFVQHSRVRVTIPAGMTSSSGGALATASTVRFRVGAYAKARVAQLLAQLGYLPLTWTPDNDSGLPADPGSGAVTVSYTQRPGAIDSGGEFNWRGSYPAGLTSLWQPGRPGVILTGALMAFQADHGLPMTGTVTRILWQVLLNAIAQGERNPHGYTYALVDQARPETLTVWHDGQVVVRAQASTGTAATPTVDGTFPVYLRNRFQVMRGLMPDGRPYADPVQFVSYFHGNYAVHSMDRTSFGRPQSLGCVELPLSEARQAWPYLTYGSLVTVTG